MLERNSHLDSIGPGVNVVRLSDLLSKLTESGGVLREVEQEVRTTYKRAQAIIKKTLREECELQLQNPKTLSGKDSRVKIPIEVLSGCPAGLEHVKIEMSREQVDETLLLASHRGDLEKVAEGGPGLAELYEELVHKDRRCLDVSSRLDASSIKATAEWAQIYLERLNETAQAIMRGIFWVERDVMGAYHCPPSTRINLYWAVIGLIARLQGWKVQDLVVKVFTHEWAHAYTQLGTDIDGEYWHAEDFRKVDLSVVEGLAQYYTHRVLERLSGKDDHLYAGAFSVYEGLLKYQSSDYQTHCNWIKGHTPETVRYAMLGFRRNKETKLEQFERRLLDVHSDFNLSRRLAG